MPTLRIVVVQRADFEGDVVAWSFGDHPEVLRTPDFEFELEVPDLGRNVPALIGLCSGSVEAMHQNQCLLHPILRCLAGTRETFDPPLRLRFPVGDVDSMESGSDRGGHEDAETAYRAHLESAFSALTRENARSEWGPIHGDIVQVEGGVFVLEVEVSHFCDFALGRDVTVDDGCVELVPLPKLKRESRLFHYHFVNLGPENIVIHVWGAARQRGFLESGRLKLGVGLTGGDVEVEAKRTLVTEPATKVYTVTVPGGSQVCRVLDRIASPTVAWTTQERIKSPDSGILSRGLSYVGLQAPSEDTGYELVQVLGSTSMTHKHALVVGRLLEGTRPSVANLRVFDGDFVGRRVMEQIEGKPVKLAANPLGEDPAMSPHR